VLYGVDWIHPVQERAQQRILMNAITLRVPWKMWNLLTSWATIGSSRTTLLHQVGQLLNVNLNYTSLVDKFKYD
jgi:hypothetical protein